MNDSTLILNGIKYYSKDEVCQLLNVHPKTLNNFISSGKLPVYRPTRNMTYITEAQITAFICGNSNCTVDFGQLKPTKDILFPTQPQ